VDYNYENTIHNSAVAKQRDTHKSVTCMAYSLAYSRWIGKCVHLSLWTVGSGNRREGSRNRRTSQEASTKQWMRWIAISITGKQLIAGKPQTLTGELTLLWIGTKRHQHRTCTRAQAMQWSRYFCRDDVYMKCRHIAVRICVLSLEAPGNQMQHDGGSKFT
jgi:hypothetical protein